MTTRLREGEHAQVAGRDDTDELPPALRRVGQTLRLPLTRRPADVSYRRSLRVPLPFNRKNLDSSLSEERNDEVEP